MPAITPVCYFTQILHKPDFRLYKHFILCHLLDQKIRQKGVYMNRKIFQAIFGTSAVVLLATAAILLSVLTTYFSRLQLSELKAETELAAAGVELNGVKYLESLEDTSVRVTYVASDGSLLYDNEADISTMENHLKREEIEEALETGYGESSRYSDTLARKCLYAAKRLDDGSVIRLSTGRDAVWLLMLGILQPMCVTLCLSIIASLVLAYKLSSMNNRTLTLL